MATKNRVGLRQADYSKARFVSSISPIERNFFLRLFNPPVIGSMAYVLTQHILLRLTKIDLRETNGSQRRRHRLGKNK